MDTLPTISASRRFFTNRPVSSVPSRPASGEELTPIVMARLGSSMRMSGNGIGFSASARVSPIVMSGIPAIAIPRREHPDGTRFNDAIHAELDRHDVDLVALLGFLSRFESRGRFSGRVINVHPALIPAFSGKGYYGHRVHEAVLESGVKITGATVHFADDEYDHGPIILQEALAVEDDDTPDSLAARVQAVERRLVPKAIRLLAEGRLAIDGRRVHIKPA